MTDNNARIRVSRSGSRMMHGGYTTTALFSAQERRWAEALIDTLIPPEDGWPPAVELGVATLMANYLVPPGAPVSLYPHFGRAEFAQLLERLGGPLVNHDMQKRVRELIVVQSADPELFARIRDFVYYVYYGHPAVVALIRSSTRYGGDYLGGGQPEGYRDNLEIWGEREFTTRGVFIPTDAVRTVRRIEGQV